MFASETAREIEEKTRLMVSCVSMAGIIAKVRMARKRRSKTLRKTAGRRK